MNRTSLLLPILFALSSIASGQTYVFQSKSKQVKVLELYTSEGCSSCPPADKWMSRLMKHPGLWTKFVPIAFHVDYWDYLGWKDIFSRPEFSKRQRTLVRKWPKPSVYTPGFLLNGKEFRVKEYKQLSTNPNSLIRLKVSATKGNQDIAVKGTINGKPTSEPLYLNSVLMVHNVKNKISSGENEGLVLEHDFAVVDMKIKKVKKQSATTNLIIPKNYSKSKLSLASWITSSKGDYLQAAGGYLQ